MVQTYCRYIASPGIIRSNRFSNSLKTQAYEKVYYSLTEFKVEIIAGIWFCRFATCYAAGAGKMYGRQFQTAPVLRKTRTFSRCEMRRKRLHD